MEAFFALLKKQLIIISEHSEEIFLNFTLITFHFTPQRTSVYVTKNCKTSLFTHSHAYDAQADLACDEADRLIRYV